MKRLKSLAKVLSSKGYILESGYILRLAADDSGLSPSWTQASPWFKNIDQDLFLSNNLEELKKIDSFAKGRYEVISSGGEGTAYVIGDASPDSGTHYVLKLDFQNYADKRDALERDLESGSTNYEVSILDWGTLLVNYLNGTENKIVWKVVEKVETPSLLDLGIQDLIDAILEDIVERRRFLEMSRARDPRSRAMIEAKYFDFLDPENVIELLSSGISSEELSTQIANTILEFGILDNTILELDKILKPGWLKEFVKSIIYLMGERGKNDLGGDNVGIRPSTGRLVWFDA